MLDSIDMYRILQMDIWILMGLSPIAKNCGGLRCSSSTVYDFDQPDMQRVIFKSPVCTEGLGLW